MGTIRKSEENTTHVQTFYGVGVITVENLQTILGQLTSAPSQAIVEVRDSVPARGEWTVTITWEEGDGDRPTATESSEGNGRLSITGRRYQVIIPKKRLGPALRADQPGRIHDAYDHRLPANFERVAPVEVTESGDDYVLIARVVDNGRSLCHYQAVDGPCIREAEHEGEWCRNAVGNTWVPYEKRGTEQQLPAAKEQHSDR